ncbi:hypothetical protein BGW39_006753 [Mortierella sp. 14UC]|nr:hypothetical protein BGW39_006753 [Mortierella sp. 14UC]
MASTITNSNQLPSDSHLLDSAALFSSNTQQQHPSLIHPHTRPSSLFLPPEILETIFHNLSQATLRKSVNPVCKQWRFLSNGLIHRTATWKPLLPTTVATTAKRQKKAKKYNKEHKEANDNEVKEFHTSLLDRLASGRVDTFECWLLGAGKGDRNHRDVSENAGVPGLWDDFVAALRDRLLLLEAPRKDHESEDEDKDEVGEVGRHHRQDGNRLSESVRTLRIYGNLVETNKVVLDLKPCFEFLESLEIYIHRCLTKSIDLFSILDNAPRLKAIVFDIALSGAVYTVPGTQATVTTTTATSKQPKHSYYPLEQLIFKGLYVDIYLAERVIKSCPRLRVLKTLHVSTDGYRANEPRWDPYDMRQASERLARLARDSCPNLQWYQSDFQYMYRLPNETRLIEMAKIFPETQHLTVMPYEDPCSNVFDPAVVEPANAPFFPFLPDLHQLINRLTVLEIAHGSQYSTGWATANRIIFLCPASLQSLFISDLIIPARDLGRPPTEHYDDTYDSSLFMLQAADWLFNTDQEQRRRDCVERHVLRNAVLSDIWPPHTHPNRDNNRPLPRMWPCRHLLRTLECKLYGDNGFAEWTNHVRAYRLFGHLTSFKVRCEEFRVGQLIHSKKHSQESSSSLEENEGVEFVMDAARFPGIVTPRDFEFMRKQNEPYTRHFPPPPSLSALQAEATTRRSNTIDSTASESDDSEDENDFGEVKAYKGVETFWPRLTTFHVNYVLMNDPAANDTRALVAGLDQIRTDVEFRFRRLYMSIH